MLDTIKTVLPWVLFAACIVIVVVDRIKIMVRLKKYGVDSSDVAAGNYLRAGICLGALLGIVLGVLFKGEYGVGISIGLFAGIVFGVIMRQVKQRDYSDAPEDQFKDPWDEPDEEENTNKKS